VSAATFRAHCARGHERIDFEGSEGAQAFEAHMKGEHKHRSIYPGAPTYQGDTKAPGWTDGEIDKPYPWRAPRPLTAAQFARRLEEYAHGLTNLGQVWNPTAKRWHANVVTPLESYTLEEVAS
jgi:hypothetical protein